ncbi:MAG: UDP-galactose-lipid carrier transferase [Thermoleophilaceae bacterium]|nr:UDP-galactose-lipid carrier transferase [Thermoleophilaceae bacterium]
MTRLDQVDLSLKIKRSEQDERLEVAQNRLHALRLQLGGKLHSEEELGPPVCVVVEGWDASGKGGAIRRMVAPMDPRHYRVTAFSAPTHDEKRHHFLWRFGPALPGWGGFAILDRSWYGRVLVERVEGYADEPVWKRGYDAINGFEKTLADEGMVLIKLWMHISSGEQLKRFKRRDEDPLKQWKLTDEDWRNREKRPAYEQAVEEMFDRTSTDWAPWHVIAAEQKKYARVAVVETVIAEIERGMRGRSFEPAGELG